MRENFNYCHIAQQTDVGCKRPANEDWLANFESPNGLVSVVCDGMGGHVGGQVASHVAVDAIQQYMMQERPNRTPFELIIEAINAANDAILQRATQQPELSGMGSTCVMLIVREGKVYIGSVGDSRVYLIRNHKIQQLTVDQSFVQMLVDAGQITKEQAEHHPRKNEITNALGLRSMQPATVLPSPIYPEAGDCFLLCSDGLSGMVSDAEICKIVSRQSEWSQQQRVEQLIIRAKRNGGLDNITCQIVEFSITPNAPIDTSKQKKVLPFVICGVFLLLIAIGVGAFFFLKPTEEEKGNKEATIIESEQTGTKSIQIDYVDIVQGDVFLTLTESVENIILKYKQFNSEKTQKEPRLSRLKEVKIISPKNDINCASINDDPIIYEFTALNKLSEKVTIQVICENEKWNIIISPTYTLKLDPGNVLKGNKNSDNDSLPEDQNDNNKSEDETDDEKSIEPKNNDILPKQEKDTTIIVENDSCKILITAKKLAAKKDTVVWTIDSEDKFYDGSTIESDWYKMVCKNHDCLIDIYDKKSIPDTAAIITQSTIKEKKIILYIKK